MTVEEAQKITEEAREMRVVRAPEDKRLRELKHQKVIAKQSRSRRMRIVKARIAKAANGGHSQIEISWRCVDKISIALKSLGYTVTHHPSVCKGSSWGVSPSFDEPGYWTREYYTVSWDGKKGG